MTETLLIISGNIYSNQSRTVYIKCIASWSLLRNKPQQHDAGGWEVFNHSQGVLFRNNDRLAKHYPTAISKEINKLPQTIN